MGERTLPAADLVLDAGQAGCGELLVLIFEQFKTMQPGQVLRVVGYDPGAWVDIPAWCRMTKNTLLHIEYPLEGIGHERTEPTLYFIRKGN
jgi:tRNA 2-thiouridine synthesizing protein A